MPKVDIDKVKVVSGTFYPAEFQAECRGRHKQPIGDAVGLTQFGVNITRIDPGAASALRHWHEQEDEFIYMLEGELVLAENSGEIVLRPGAAAGFKSGSGNAHRLINRSDRVAIYFEVGTRAKSERVHYPDVDLVMERDETGRRYLHKDGRPY
ncbi:MAG TPA: cupin domain-containing protein [Pseudolabrys sp.]|nr:cupin domain-containing protein [Pseudolabrys sp.]